MSLLAVSLLAAVCLGSIAPGQVADQVSVSTRRKPFSPVERALVVFCAGGALLLAVMIGVALHRASAAGTQRAVHRRAVERAAERNIARMDREDARNSRRLRRALRQNFGGGYGLAPTSWYGDIESVKVTGDAAWITTDIYPDGDAAAPSEAICAAAVGSLRPTVTRATVAASDGSILQTCP